MYSFSSLIGSLVDRILRQQKAEREAAERAHRASLVSSSDTLVHDQDAQTKIPATETKVLPPPTPLGSATRPSTQTIGTSLEQILKRPTSAISDFGRLLRHNRSNTSSRRGDDATQSSILDASGVSPTPTPNIPQGGSLQPSTGQGPTRSPNSGGPNVTPLSNICTFCGSGVPKW